MQSHADWSTWAETLRRYRLDGLVSWLLEAGSPLNIVGAQILYMGDPFVGGNIMGSMAQMLENEEESRKFAGLLRGEISV